ncbi:hypothetical protein [Nostoc sp. PCC 7524]|uniref:hypothetical protein n=1 Tax=Nostoc sp. (strain ATCC 29411 / PCC 7524) TaxID=28072 RepID=UPI000AD76E04|nr:hypothetical protein [Nostoc sp. PCC 7524]
MPTPPRHRADNAATGGAVPRSLWITQLRSPFESITYSGRNAIAYLSNSKCRTIRQI